jgi:acylphosphatase
LRIFLENLLTLVTSSSGEPDTARLPSQYITSDPTEQWEVDCRDVPLHSLKEPETGGIETFPSSSANAIITSGEERLPMSERCVRAVVWGRVQGVWFRESTRQCAEELGVRGYVRNLPDGRVEAVLAGDAAAVAAALEFLRDGPPMARVDQIEIEEPYANADHRDFRVRY